MFSCGAGRLHRKPLPVHGFLLPQQLMQLILGSKNKNRSGDQVPPKESSICGKKKDVNFVWVQRCMTAQLSIKLKQCRITKNGPVIEQPNPPGLKRLKVRFVTIDFLLIVT
ncbi:hypothetical protein AB205_0212640 [Aquarana catesbeiana]|uniref:Uncharacterized protein n=1 Tax=Aquarana catesbeiana TaxID=8400 RepID=A0A2G9RX95_AQUCT|nr:hypothetical protein AB205_0212640 [Aquarana catesbeiana]